MREALARVKRELGADAVILGTRSVPAGAVGSLVGRQRVEVTAAPPSTPTPAPRIAGPVPRTARLTTVPPEVYPYYIQLVQSEMGEELAERVVRQAASGIAADQTAERFRERMRAVIAGLVPTSSGITLTPGCPRRVALVGPPGGGKTTTLAKLAAQFKLRMSKNVAILSFDTYRLAADQQLRRYAELIGVPMVAARTIEQAEDSSQRLEPADLLLIDTPGVGPRDRDRLARLTALLRAVQVHEVHLVMPICLAEPVRERTAQMYAPSGVSRVVLTRLDEVVGLGVLLTAVAKMGWALSYVTDGQNVPKNIQEACGRQLAELILPAPKQATSDSVKW